MACTPNKTTLLQFADDTTLLNSELTQNWKDVETRLQNGINRLNSWILDNNLEVNEN